MAEPIAITERTRRPDAEIAAEVRAALMEKLGEVCEIMSEAHRAGLLASFQLAQDATGRQFIAALQVARVFTG